MSLDFEGVMRFFRVNLPKKYRSEDHADELIQAACAMKVETKKSEHVASCNVDVFVDQSEEIEAIREGLLSSSSRRRAGRHAVATTRSG